MLPIDELHAYENNAKLHPQEQIDQIVKSMQEFGNNDPIAIDENNRIIEGHGRLLALKQMGEKEAPIIRLSHLTDEQKRAYILVHNQLTLNTGFDEELLRMELEGIVDIDMGEYGFDLDILDIEEEPPLVEEDSDFDVTPPEEPKSKPGDLYQLGCHRLLCGDSTSLDDVAKLMGEEKADLLITDPPYNVNYQGGTEDKLTIQNDNMADEDFRQFLRDVYSAADSVMKPGLLSTYGTPIRRGTTSGGPPTTSAGRFANASSGTRTRSSWEGSRIIGSTSLAYSDGSLAERTAGTETASRRPCSTSTNRSATASIRR